MKKLKFIALGLILAALCLCFTACSAKAPVSYSGYDSRDEFVAAMEEEEKTAKEGLFGIFVYYKLDIEPFDVRADYSDLNLQPEYSGTYFKAVAYCKHYADQMFERMGVKTESEEYTISYIISSAYISFYSLETFLKYEEQFIEGARTDKLVAEIIVGILDIPVDYLDDV